MGTVTVSVRMSRPELNQLEHWAEDVGLDRSSFDDFRKIAQV